MSLTPGLIAASLSLGTSFVISLILTPIIRRAALRRGFVDQPSGTNHKKHAQPTALGGGIAITVACLFPLLLALLIGYLLHRMDPGALPGLAARAPNWHAWAGGIVEKRLSALAVIAGALVLHLLGLLDDHRPLSPWLKLTVQFAVALTLTLGFEIRAAELLGPAGAVIVTTLWIVVLTNAFNFMDNMDGLSAGVAGLTALVLGMSAFSAGQVFVPCMLMVLAGAVLGFLVYNFPPAKVFMGDAGSLVIGYLLAVATILTTYIYPEQQQTPFGVLVPIVVFAVPLYDFTSVVIDRLRRGVSVFRGDRRHFSHRLVESGLTPTTAVLTIYLATTATSLTAILLPLVHWPGAVLILGQCLCVVAIIAILESRGRS